MQVGSQKVCCQKVNAAAKDYCKIQIDVPFAVTLFIWYPWSELLSFLKLPNIFGNGVYWYPKLFGEIPRFESIICFHNRFQHVVTKNRMSTSAYHLNSKSCLGGVKFWKRSICGTLWCCFHVSFFDSISISLGRISTKNSFVQQNFT